MTEFWDWISRTVCGISTCQICTNWKTIGRTSGEIRSLIVKHGVILTCSEINIKTSFDLMY